MHSVIDDAIEHHKNKEEKMEIYINGKLTSISVVLAMATDLAPTGADPLTLGEACDVLAAAGYDLTVPADAD